MTLLDQALCRSLHHSFKSYGLNVTDNMAYLQSTKYHFVYQIRLRINKIVAYYAAIHVLYYLYR